MGLVALLIVIGAVNYCDRAAISSVLPLVRSDLRMSNLELAEIGSFFLWAYAMASPVGGLLADRESRSRLIVWSLVAESVLTLLTGFVTSAHQLLFVRVILGFVEAAYLPAAMALIADYHSSQTRATAIGFHTAGLSLGLVAGGAAAGYIGKHYGWQIGFVLLGAAGLALAVAAQLVLRDATPAGARRLRAPNPPLLAGIVALIRTPSCLVIILAGMASAVGNNIFLNWFPLYFTETYRMSLPRASLAGTFVLHGAGVIGLVAGSVFSDRFAGLMPRRRMLILIVSTFLATPFLLVFFSLRPGLVLLNFCIFMFSFLHKFGDSNTAPLICDLLPPKLRSTAFGFQNSANCVAGGIGVLIAGLLKSRLGLGGVFVEISGMTLISAVILLTGHLLFLRRDLARRAKAETQRPLNPPRSPRLSVLWDLPPGPPIK